MKLPYTNTQIKHWNEGASMPLIMPLHVVMNTSEEQIIDNVRKNSRLDKVWLYVSEEHNGVAILCGSGPSLKDSLEHIREWTDYGGVIFAMNGAAQFLADHGIIPDYQCLIDARPETAQLIGPAYRHLFASQCAPICFEKVPDATLWHLQIGGIENVFPDYDGPYTLVGGAASMGNTALPLVYCLGFREMHCYGYDSSHRETGSHAFRQPMNDGEPTCSVDFGGKTYITSLTMKLQAERFLETSHALKSMGVSISVHGDGLLPALYNSDTPVLDEHLSLTEQAKYEAMWSLPVYRDLAPGEDHVRHMIALLSCYPGDTILDFGTGTGRAAQQLQDMGYAVTGLDLAENCLDSGIDIPLVHACLWSMPDITAKWGLCTDVMEHIPPEKVDEVLSGIAVRTDACYFAISVVHDNLGQLIGETLHMTVRSADWWHDTLKKYWADVKRVQSNAVDVVFTAHRRKVQ